MNKKTEALVLSIMCFILAMAIVVQMNTVSNNGTTVGKSSETNNLKAQVLRMKEKYETQYRELENAQNELEKVRQQITNNNGDLEELENKIKKDNLLLGNTNVSGNGVVITLTDGQTDSVLLEPENLIIHAENVLAVVNELKNAGAEAISINGQRVVNTTAIPCDGNVIIVNGSKISSPIEISAIGLPEMLSTLNRAGGTLERFKNYGKGVDFKKNNNVKIPKYSGVITFKYAKTVR